MATFDFAQWKWMQLRSIESAQSIEKENIELRKRLVELQSVSSGENKQTKDALRGFSSFLKSWLQKHKEVRHKRSGIALSAVFARQQKHALMFKRFFIRTPLY
jgi:CRISPR/Cas system CMR subunit Cmr6 (Cas7 group RAMP superfamily)